MCMYTYIHTSWCKVYSRYNMATWKNIWLHEQCLDALSSFLPLYNINICHNPGSGLCRAGHSPRGGTTTSGIWPAKAIRVSWPLSERDTSAPTTSHDHDENDQNPTGLSLANSLLFFLHHSHVTATHKVTLYHYRWFRDSLCLWVTKSASPQLSTRGWKSCGRSLKASFLTG